MRWKVWCLAGILCYAGVPAVSADPDNPKISVKLESVSAIEAIEALSKASQIVLETDAISAPALPGAVAQRASFDWSDITFAKALRQLCATYGLQPVRMPNGFRFFRATPVVQVNPENPVGLVEKQGVRLFVRSVSSSASRTLNLERGQNAQPELAESSGVNLQLQAFLEEGSASRIAGINNIRARDDLGNEIRSAGQMFFSPYFGMGYRYPDEWQGTIALGKLDPKARKLVWLEADFVVFSTVSQVRLEMPMPREGQVVRQEHDGVQVFSALASRGPDPLEAVPLPGPRPQHLGKSLILRTRFVVPPDGGGRPSAYSGNRTPVLVGKSGKRSTPGSVSQTGFSVNGHQIYELTCEFRNVPDDVETVQWTMQHRSDPQRLFTFRMVDIPLPPSFADAAPGRPIPQPDRPAAVMPPPADRPFFQRGGSTLVCPIEIAGKDAPSGALELGLAKRTETGFGPTRWLELLVGQDGKGTLEDLEPGTYRVQRRYRADKPGAVPMGGTWIGTTVDVTIPAGKTVMLPPLKWSVKASTPAPPAGKVPSRR